jgi:hypothetical protein
MTTEGAAWIWTGLVDQLAGSRIVVVNGTEKASAEVERTAVDGRELTLTATFGEDDANFEWTAREVVTSQGIVLDRQEGDFGRKPPGAIWVIDAVLELGAGE